jgi:hypothetical protein
MSPESACTSQGFSPAVPYAAKFRLWLVSEVSQDGRWADGRAAYGRPPSGICYAMASTIALKVSLGRIAFDVLTGSGS